MSTPFYALGLLIPVAFIGLWLFVLFVLSQLGWNRLRDFATHSAPHGQNFGFQSANIGGVRYRAALHFTVAPNGLYLRPLWLFSHFHRPLFIPYGAFGAYETRNGTWFNPTQFTVHNAHGQQVKVTLESKALGDAVITKIREQRALQGGSLRSSAPLR